MVYAFAKKEILMMKMINEFPVKINNHICIVMESWEMWWWNINKNEECDDGNNIDRDGCSNWKID